MFNLFKSKVEAKTKIIDVESEITVTDMVGTAVLLTGEIIPFNIEGRVTISKIAGYPKIEHGAYYYNKMLFEGSPLYALKDGVNVYYPMSAIKHITAKVKHNKVVCTYKEEVPV